MFKARTDKVLSEKSGMLRKDIKNEKVSVNMQLEEYFLTKEEKFKYVVYIALAGCGLVGKDCSVKIQRMNSFFRDFILRLVKSTLKDYLAGLSFGEVPAKPIQVVTALENYIAFR